MLWLRSRDGYVGLSAPLVSEDLISSSAELSMLFVQLCCIGGLVHHIRSGSRLCAILIWYTSHFLSGPCYMTVSLQPRVFRNPHEWQATKMLRMIKIHRRIGVYDILLRTVARWDERILAGFCGRSCVPCFGGSRTLVTRHVLFSKTLLDSFGFPIVISHPTTSFDDSRSKLTEHRFGRHNRDLPRPIRIW